jgi:uncharacterized membrane protein YdjX (TVP38/TMEM64 family)
VSENGRSYTFWIKWGAVAVCVVGVIVLPVRLPVRELLRPFHDSLRQLGFAGVLVFIGIYIVGTLLLLPGGVFTVAAGLVFGLRWAVAGVTVAATVSVMAAFLIARYAARDRVERLVKRHPRFQAVDRAVGEEGWKVVVLLRLSPALPFGLQNYLYGLTAIRFWPCVLTSAVAMLPGTVMYAYIGYLARAGVWAGSDDGADLYRWILRIAGFVATVAFTGYVMYRGRMALRERVAEEEQKQDETE